LRRHCVTGLVFRCGLIFILLKSLNILCGVVRASCRWVFLRMAHRKWRDDPVGRRVLPEDYCDAFEILRWLRVPMLLIGKSRMKPFCVSKWIIAASISWIDVISI